MYFSDEETEPHTKRKKTAVSYGQLSISDLYVNQQA